MYGPGHWIYGPENWFTSKVKPINYTAWSQELDTSPEMSYCVYVWINSSSS